MDKLKKVIAAISNFIESVNKAMPPLGLKFDRERETKKEITMEFDENGSCIKREVHHEKSKTAFSIGILLKKDDDKPQLFISIDNVRMLMDTRYLFATPICHKEEPSNKEGEIWYAADESISKEYFSETTSETRKDEIIEQILAEVVKSLNEVTK